MLALSRFGTISYWNHGFVRRVADHRTAKRFLVSGSVQGVGYRFFTQRAARRLGISGYVKNLRDGRVEVYAVGTEALLDDFRTELWRGPSAASVSRVAVEQTAIDSQHSVEFSIEYSD